MAGYRFSLDLFIPESTYDSIPLSVKTNIRDRIRQLKSYAIRLNEGQLNEEVSIRAVWHKCYHDEDPQKTCDAEQEI